VSQAHFELEFSVLVYCPVSPHHISCHIAHCFSGTCHDACFNETILRSFYNSSLSLRHSYSHWFVQDVYGVNKMLTVDTAYPQSTALDDIELDIPSPKLLEASITIITDADVTWCRPWPNTAVHHHNSAQFYKGTPISLTCWLPNDIPEKENGPGLSKPIDIWVKTGDMGCYINENDLRSANINFEDTLHLCGQAGPHPLSGNRPEELTTVLNSNKPPPLTNAPAVMTPPSANPPKPPVYDNNPSLNPNPSAVAPNLATTIIASPLATKLPSPGIGLPTNINQPSPKPLYDNAPPVFPNPSLVPIASPKSIIS
jgi:hypothetical protein